VRFLEIPVFSPKGKELCFVMAWQCHAVTGKPQNLFKVVLVLRQIKN